jgi:tetratricopeptide (TPR) repeat protein
VLAHSIIREADRRNRKVKEAQALITLARIQQQTKRLNEAIQTLNAAERLTSSGNFARLSADIQLVLADLYRERGGIEQRSVICRVDYSSHNELPRFG